MENEKEILKTFSKLEIDVNFITKLKGGINSNVYKINSESEKYIIKFFPENKKDKRNRFVNETNFIKFLNKNGIEETIPKIIFEDIEKKFVVYNYIDGTKIKLIDNNLISNVLVFFRKLYELKSSKNFEGIQNASEACFSIKEHIEIVMLKLKNFENLDESCSYSKEVSIWVKDILKLRMKKITKYINKISYLKNYKIKAEEKILSTSDVGIHNMIKNDGRFFFYDFEYAGWDDVAKYISDWLLRPNQEMSVNNQKIFTDGIANIINSSEFRLRMDIMLNIYSVKWCLIILNKTLDPSLPKKFKINALNNSIKYFNKYSQKPFFSII